MKKIREASEKAVEAIQSAQHRLEFSIGRRRDADRQINEEIITLLSLNATHGLELPCSSFEEWAKRYDNGRKDAKKVSVTSTIAGMGGGAGYRQHGKNEKLVVRDYSLDKAGKLYYAPKNVTRIVDDFLNQMRQEHPDVMNEVDRKLSQANAKIRGEVEQQV
jgi:hypothetical protein